MTQQTRKALQAVLTTTLLAAMALTGCARWSPRVEEALTKSGANRGEIEKALRHFARAENPEKLEAAEFLIANMPGHGYSLVTYQDKDGNDIDFDIHDYKNFNEAQAALDQLREKHKGARYKRKRFDEDLETISADLLIENVDLAFKAWREKPWARNLTFDAFCEYVLPHRGSNEPLDVWRRECYEATRDDVVRIANPLDPKTAAGVVGSHMGRWARFDSIYYLHPTDQSYSEMRKFKMGRCEDLSNLYIYLLRANAVPCASDYTPLWADRDNNHAWTVVLDSQGRGNGWLSNRAAKIYRKMYSFQAGSLGAIKGEDEKVPGWLSRPNYIDVTHQYLDTSDVTIELTEPVPDGARFAYICVFNGGHWGAIHWAPIKDGRATFTNMGRDIAYLPAYYVKREKKDGEEEEEEDGPRDGMELVGAAPVFILTKEGEVRPLKPDAGETLRIEATKTVPDTPDADTQVIIPRVVVEPGQTYELFVWENDWTSLGEKTAGDDPVYFDDVPAGGLYWLVREKDVPRNLERIFTFEDGRQVWW